MNRVVRTALMAYSSAEIYALVNDVARYKEFLPACIASQVLEETALSMTARMAFSRMGIAHALVTKNHLTPHTKITAEFVSGPFETLAAQWDFLALTDSACKVSFSIEFQLHASFLQFAASAPINQAATQTVDAFQKRAVQIYGTR